MTNVIELASAERAWDEYRALVEAQRNDQHLLTDFHHQSKIALAHARWQRLFLLDARP